MGCRKKPRKSNKQGSSQAALVVHRDNGVVISFIVSFVLISKARAERDSYNQKLVHATQQLDSYVAAYGNIKSK